MKFTKMQGAGNDFIVINNMEEKLPQAQFAALARRLCTRRMSIGADGMMIVDAPQNGGDYRMYFYNADGSLGEMCGNGARCIARYGYEKGLAGETQRVETTAGLVVGQRRDKRMYTVRLNDITKFAQDVTAKIDGKAVQCDYLELGDPGLPHAVVLLDGDCAMTQEALRELGRKLRANSAFPKGANVNFCRVIGENEVEELTYERGVEDFTLACGTGTMSFLLAERGYEVIGVDFSPEMLAVAAEKSLEGEGEAPIFLCQSMEKLDLYGTVDACVCLLDSVNHVTEPDRLQQALRRVWLFLEAGGLFIFDVHTPEHLQSLDGGLFLDETDDAYCVWRTEYDPEEAICTYGMDVFQREGEAWYRSTEVHEERAYSIETLTEALRQAGFLDIHTYGDRRLDAPQAGEARVFFTARKPEEAIEHMR